MELHARKLAVRTRVSWLDLGHSRNTLVCVCCASISSDIGHAALRQVYDGGAAQRSALRLASVLFRRFLMA
eukprot:1050417-Rhodomonas_salina.3